MNSRRFGALFVIELVLAAALVLLAAQLLSDSAEKSPTDTPEVPTEDSPSTGLGGPIEKVVDIVKENRTFDNMFGRYPGPDGAPTGRYFERLRGSPETDSRSLPARHRPQLPSRAHGVNGGDMNGFDLIPGGRDFAFTQYRRGTCLPIGRMPTTSSSGQDVFVDVRFNLSRAHVLHRSARQEGRLQHQLERPSRQIVR